MSLVEFHKIDQLKQVLNLSNGTEIHWEGFQTVVDICHNFVSNSDLKHIMETRVGKKQFSLIVIQLSEFFTKKGFFRGRLIIMSKEQNKKQRYGN